MVEEEFRELEARVERLERLMVRYLLKEWIEEGDYNELLELVGSSRKEGHR